MRKTTPKQAVEAYITGVLSGSIPASRAIRLAVERHVRDLETAKVRDLYFDEKAAARAIAFFRVSETQQRRVGRPVIRAGAVAEVYLVGSLRVEAQGRAAAL